MERDENKIHEIQEIIADCYKRGETAEDPDYYIDTKEAAEKVYDWFADCCRTSGNIYNTGYRKQVWHKVADGDLPKKEGKYYVFIKVANYTFYNVLDFSENKFIMYDSEYGEFITVEEVIAWTELPEYKE